MDTVDSLSLDYNASLSYSYKQYRADTLSGTVISSQCICLPDALNHMSRARLQMQSIPILIGLAWATFLPQLPINPSISGAME